MEEEPAHGRIPESNGWLHCPGPPFHNPRYGEKMNRALPRLALLATLAGCGSTPPIDRPQGEAPRPEVVTPPPAVAEPATPATTPPPSLTPQDLEVLARGDDFGFQLFSRLRNTAGNLVFSPASIRIALAMTYGGARGETAQQMMRTLSFPADDVTATHRAYGNALRVWNATESATLRVANRIYAERTAPIEPAFTGLTRDSYAAEARSVDFIGAFEPARLEINEWIAAQTERRIEDLLPPGSLDSLTRLVLANAIYFKGTWRTQFDPARTTPMSFTLADGGRPFVNMMQTKARFSYARHPDGLRILEMPYAGDQLRMVWLLPEAVDGLAALEARLDAAALRRWRAATREVEVEVGIPRFRLEPPTTTLSRTLTAMGMPLAFDPRADFTGIATLPGGLYISEVFHKAFIEVNEEGTEAAAATAVVMVTRGMAGPEPERPRFYADHPFLFALVDQRTGSILFLGRVADPR